MTPAIMRSEHVRLTEVNELFEIMKEAAETSIRNYIF